MTPGFRLVPFDERGIFSAAAESGDLRRLAIRGAGASVFAKSATFCLQFASVIILARLLAPADFGLLAMVTTFSLLLVNFGLNGFTEALIQREQLDHFLASNLFWINVTAGLILTIGFAASGSLLAWFYRDPLVSRVAVAISPTILLGNAGYLHSALLKRAMRFAAVSANDVMARCISIAVSILLAWVGWSYWALVVGTVAGSLSATLGAVWLCRWVPGPPRRRAGTDRVIRFAVPVYARFSIGYVLRNMDNVLVGWRFAAVALGYYKRAYDLFALSADQLVAPLADVSLATLSRLRRDPAQYVRYLVNSLGIISFVGMAVGADLTLVGKDVVYLVLGPKWAESGKIFTLFGPGIGIMLLHNCYGWIHLSIGKPGRWLRWSLVEFAVTGCLFFLALQWGPAGIAAAWSVSFWILTIPAFWYAGRPIQFGVSSFVAAVWKYALAALLSGSATAATFGGMLFRAAPPSVVDALEAILLVSTVFVALYLGVVILLHWGCAPLRQLASLLREIVPSRVSGRPAVQSV
jgi:O-antigen/teichoic acid export membrane protein